MKKKIFLILVSLLIFTTGCNNDILVNPGGLNNISDSGVEIIDASIDKSIHSDEEIKLLKKAEEISKNQERKYYLLENPDFRNAKWSFNEWDVKEFETALLLIDFQNLEEGRNIDLDKDQNILLFTEKIDGIYFDIYYYFKNEKLEKVSMLSRSNSSISDYKNLIKKLNNKYNKDNLFEDSFIVLSEEKKDVNYKTDITKASSYHIIEEIDNGHLFLSSLFDNDKSIIDLKMLKFQNEVSIVIDINKKH